MAEKIISRKEARALGLKRYFTGQPCKYGHITERRVSDCACVQCGVEKARNPDERERRREYMRDHQRRYRAENGDVTRATMRESYARNAEKRREAVREKRAANPDEHKAVLRKSYAKHKDRRNAECREYQKNNPDLVRQHRRNRKARVRNAEGTHTAADVTALFESQNGKCVGCETDLAAGYHVDHIVPIARGGSNWPGNLQLLCPFCNLSKKDKLMDEWLAQRKKTA